MNNYHAALQLNKAFNVYLRQITLQARSGSAKAATDLLHGMCAHHISLQALGYNINDQGRVIKYAPPTPAEKSRADLILKAQTGDVTAAATLLASLSSHIPHSYTV